MAEIEFVSRMSALTELFSDCNPFSSCESALLIRQVLPPSVTFFSCSAPYFNELNNEIPSSCEQQSIAARVASMYATEAFVADNVENRTLTLRNAEIDMHKLAVYGPDFDTLVAPDGDCVNLDGLSSL